MGELIEELLKAANLLQTVKVGGEYWLTMAAVYGSIVQTAQKLQESEAKQQDESINDGPDA